MAKVYLSLGTNLGNKESNIELAKEAISHIGNLICTSSLYATKPWGYSSSHDFLNCALEIETALKPTELLQELQQIEKNLGRKQKVGDTYEDRIIDIDILFYDNIILITPELTIPHPYIAERDFVLIPLAEIAPKMSHPLLGKTIQELEETRKKH